LDEVLEIKITKNSLSQNIAYEFLENALEENAIILLTKEISFTIPNTERVKYTIDDKIMMNAYFSLENSTQDSLISKIFIEQNFDLQYITAIELIEAKPDSSFLMIEGDPVISEKGVDIGAKIQPDSYAYPNSTQLSLCLTSKKDFSLV